MTTPLIAVAHGSRDPRAAATITELLGVVRGLRPGLDARVAFLELSAPRLADSLATVHAQGHRSAVVVPLLLGSAYHAKVDVPGVVARTSARLPRLDVAVSDVLGPDPRLEEVALDRLARAGADVRDGDLGVLLAGAGSSHAPANAAVSEVAAGWERRTRWHATAGFASAGPDAATAVHALRTAGRERIAVGSWFLAPGLLPDRVTDAVRALEPEAAIAAPLGADERIASLVLDRYDEAAAARLPELRSA